MPVLHALRIQFASLAVLAAVRYLIPHHTPILPWVLLQSCGAAVLSMRWNAGPHWVLFQIVLPVAVWAQFALAVPVWLYPLLLLVLMMIYGGSIATRAPLYNSGLACWKELAELIPNEADARFVDLGAGLGGPLAYLARHRPQALLMGVEASPLIWLIGRLRTIRFGHRCAYRLGSLWKTDIREADVVYAFLSPAPMAELWAKARREMRPGALLVSHSFEVPGQTPLRRIPLPGRKGACLLVYNVQGSKL
ncbi:MAG: class I SAM-dependent methyltransferase [Holophagaceae bacterium]|nr:class I SAM-dependent methyltransferase [Holophagaceae bacterium]